MSTASHPRQTESAEFGVALVGMGVANTFTLIEYLGRLRPGLPPVRVLLIDRGPDFFGGVAYGARSGDLGLIISRLADFLPASHETSFREWLAANRDRAFARFLALGGQGVEDWRRDYDAFVDAGVIDDVFLPRYVFGLYLETIAQDAIARAHERGVAFCEAVIGDVVELEPAPDGFRLTVIDPEGRTNRFGARRVVLGIGRTPSQRLLDPPAPRADLAMIDDPFEPGVADMMQRIRTAAGHRAAPARVVLAGSNAGALDVIFNLMNDPVVSAAIGSIEVVSPSGALPQLFHRTSEDARRFESQALDALARRDRIRADDILDAVASDIEGAHGAGLTITDTFGDISSRFLALLDRLPPAEKLRFATSTGPRIGALQRKVGYDYWKVVDRLAGEGRLVLTRGTVPRGGGGYATRDDVLAIVNCSGSARLTDPDLASPLLRGLIERGALTPTESGFGVRVNDDLEAGIPGLYVIGPQLTGNVIDGSPTWNLEHCGRLAAFGAKLAARLADPEPARVTT
jgi:uncharacterized NAD(P)/FAD-binding protein YdhS